ncbi:hypothetical protein BGZ81_007214 [Podila clonocystis]|nr:hypothetical protein BGZ81_007214 [Podila clonocystis]
MDPRKLKVQELKDQLQLAGLSTAGKKEDLVARLLEHQKVEEEVAAAAADAGPLTGSGEGFEWDDSKYDVDDLAPPVDSAAPETKPAPATSTPNTTAAKPTAPATSTATASTTATAAATSTPSSTTTTTSAPVEFQGAPAGKDAETLKAEYEKRKNRAARFGIPLKEQDKALERAARFGVPVTAKATASLAKATGSALPAASTALPNKPGSIKAQIPADVLSKRAERFGTQATTNSTTTTTTTTTSSSTPKATAGTKHSLYKLDEAEEEKKRKRAAKFGAPASN